MSIPSDTARWDCEPVLFACQLITIHPRLPSAPPYHITKKNKERGKRTERNIGISAYDEEERGEIARVLVVYDGEKNDPPDGGKEEDEGDEGTAGFGTIGQRGD